MLKKFANSLVASGGKCGVVSCAVVLSASALLAGCSQASFATDNTSARGKDLIGQYGCGTCHTIPGIDTANGRVGPPLAGIADRIFIAGRLQNSPENIAKWIADPQSISPGSAMPNMGVKPEDAREIADYLETLHDEK